MSAYDNYCKYRDDIWSLLATLPDTCSTKTSIANKMNDLEMAVDLLDVENKRLKRNARKQANKNPWIDVSCELPKENVFVKVKLNSGRHKKMMYFSGNWFDSNEIYWDSEEERVIKWKYM